MAILKALWSIGSRPLWSTLAAGQQLLHCLAFLAFVVKKNGQNWAKVDKGGQIAGNSGQRSPKVGKKKTGKNGQVGKSGQKCICIHSNIPATIPAPASITSMPTYHALSNLLSVLAFTLVSASTPSIQSLHPLHPLHCPQSIAEGGMLHAGSLPSLLRGRGTPSLPPRRDLRWAVIRG